MVLTVLMLNSDNRGVGGVCEVTFDQLLMMPLHTSMAARPGTFLSSVFLEAFMRKCPLSTVDDWFHFNV